MRFWNSVFVTDKPKITLLLGDVGSGVVTVRPREKARIDKPPRQ
jgi:hypothetical protein